MTQTTRRSFLHQTSLATAAAAVGAGCSTPTPTKRLAKHGPVIISTWGFGKPANELALRTLQGGGSALDAVEQGIRLVEVSGNSSVGLSGKPNAAGVPQLDACIMNGPGHQAGSVAGVEGVVHPISAARLVMEKTPHVMLVGRGARWFAVQQGLKVLDPTDDEANYKAWQAAQKKPSPGKGDKPDNHDTVTLIVLDTNGDLAGGCSTSGWSGKIPGRVGDSPIIGGGLYVDNEVGAAGATGLGENVMRYCASFLIVEYMRQGLHPEDACLETIRRIAAADPRPAEDLAINFVALDKQGRYGAAGTGQGFEYAVAYPGYSEVLQSTGVSNADIGPEGGNRR